MNRIIIALLVVVITLISITLYNVPKAEKIVTSLDIIRPQVEAVTPKLIKTYDNICMKGITMSVKKGSVGTVLGKKIPDNDMDINLKVPC